MASGVVDQISIVAKKANGTDTALSFHFSVPITKKAADYRYLRPSEIGLAGISVTSLLSSAAQQRTTVLSHRGES